MPRSSPPPSVGGPRTAPAVLRSGDADEAVAALSGALFLAPAPRPLRRARRGARAAVRRPLRRGELPPRARAAPPPSEDRAKVRAMYGGAARDAARSARARAHRAGEHAAAVPLYDEAITLKDEDRGLWLHRTGASASANTRRRSATSTSASQGRGRRRRRRALPAGEAAPPVQGPARGAARRPVRRARPRRRDRAAGGHGGAPRCTWKADVLEAAVASGAALEQLDARSGGVLKMRPCRTRASSGSEGC